MGISRALQLLSAGFLLGAAVPAVPLAGELSFDDRVAAQRAIEQVYWNHRIWPAENPGPKPPLSAVLSDAAIRARVNDYLRESSALESLWQRPITSAQLQAEIDRMARKTRDAAILSELFAALGNDPHRIAETLARQTMADRLIRDWYELDSRRHAATRAVAEADRSACAGVSCMRSMRGEYRETTIAIGGDAKEPEPGRARVEAAFGIPIESVPFGRLSAVEETRDSFAVTAVVSRDENELTVASVEWPKVPFDRWWSTERESHPASLVDQPGPYARPNIVTSACTDDTWTPTAGAVDPRADHTAVWTGSEMIVWGGYTIVRPSTNSIVTTKTGGRYNPATDTWTPISWTDAPVPRRGHTAVWTGSTMIVWGGMDGGVSGGVHFNSGGRYDPITDTWTPTSTGANVPVTRANHAAVWSGTEMIVWGGDDNSLAGVNTGGRYNPITDAWTPTSIGANVPSGRSYPVAVWTGSEMVVWGGVTFGGGPSNWFNTGGRYSPATDTWSPTSIGANVPSARAHLSIVWAGTVMIVWGGSGSGGQLFNTGGRYSPSTDTWSPTSTNGVNVPAARDSHSAVWTGTAMLVWGGTGGSPVAKLSTGGRYDPLTDTWTAAISTGANAPAARAGHTAVWTGSEMLVWGGLGGVFFGTGGRYTPSSNNWLPLPGDAPNVPSARYNGTSVWTGTEMIVWGGSDTTRTNSGGRYRPATDSWLPTSLGANVPSARQGHTSVWTGSEMLVWGGQVSGSTVTNSGGRYGPAMDSWLPTSLGANVPSARQGHTSVWTGTEMIVWGGISGATFFNSGGRFDPVTQVWTATSQGPLARFGHTAVWTGAEMIVWGGVGLINGIGVNLNSGGRYNPKTNAWAGTSSGLSARSGQLGLWTGAEMILWGGQITNPDFTWGLYNPASDVWSIYHNPFSSDAGPVIWTGAQLIVWGSPASRWTRATDNWTPTSMGPDAPPPRDNPLLAWTGTQMIVWGGPSATGGLYCACPSGRFAYPDFDGDGHGQSNPIAFCDGIIPAGYVDDGTDCSDTDPNNWASCSTCRDADGDGHFVECDRYVTIDGPDCDDGKASVYPGAPEINDGIDNQCPGNAGYGEIDEVSGVAFASLGDTTRISWQPQSGAASYEVARSSDRSFAVECTRFFPADDFLDDPDEPAAGTVFHYLVRASTPHTGTWGRLEDGTERILGCP